jgi:hypothetical protein
MVEFFFDGWFAEPAVRGEFRAASAASQPVNGGE